MSYSGEKLNKFSPRWPLDWPGEVRVVKISGVKSRIKQTFVLCSSPSKHRLFDFIQAILGLDFSLPSG